MYRLGRAIAAPVNSWAGALRALWVPSIVQHVSTAVSEVPCLRTPFCDLIHFEREAARQDPKVLLVAPLSGHHASLLPDTVERLLPDHDLYVTDWIDARLVPLSRGTVRPRRLPRHMYTPPFTLICWPVM